MITALLFGGAIVATNLINLGFREFIAKPKVKASANEAEYIRNAKNMAVANTAVTAVSAVGLSTAAVMLNDYLNDSSDNDDESSNE